MQPKLKVNVLKISGGKKLFFNKPGELTFKVHYEVEGVSNNTYISQEGRDSLDAYSRFCARYLDEDGYARYG